MMLLNFKPGPSICRACLARKIDKSNVRFASYYSVLGLSKNATQQQIREAYLEMSKKEHPDQNKDAKESHDRFVKINEAYNVLSKASSRRDYDQSILYNYKTPFQDSGKTSYPNPGGAQYSQRGYPFTDKHETPYANDPFAEHNYDYFQSRREWKTNRRANRKSRFYASRRPWWYIQPSEYYHNGPYHTWTRDDKIYHFFFHGVFPLAVFAFLYTCYYSPGGPGYQGAFDDAGGADKTSTNHQNPYYNIEYPDPFHGHIHLNYKEINKKLHAMLEDRTLIVWFIIFIVLPFIWFCNRYDLHVHKNDMEKFDSFLNWILGWIAIICIWSVYAHFTPPDNSTRTDQQFNQRGNYNRSDAEYVDGIMHRIFGVLAFFVIWRIYVATLPPYDTESIRMTVNRRRKIQTNTIYFLIFLIFVWYCVITSSMGYFDYKYYNKYDTESIRMTVNRRRKIRTNLIYFSIFLIFVWYCVFTSDMGYFDYNYYNNLNKRRRAWFDIKAIVIILRCIFLLFAVYAGTRKDYHRGKKEQEARMKKRKWTTVTVPKLLTIYLIIAYWLGTRQLHRRNVKVKKKEDT